MGLLKQRIPGPLGNANADWLVICWLVASWFIAIVGSWGRNCSPAKTSSAMRGWVGSPCWWQSQWDCLILMIVFGVDVGILLLLVAGLFLVIELSGVVVLFILYNSCISSVWLRFFAWGRCQLVSFGRLLWYLVDGYFSIDGLLFCCYCDRKNFVCLFMCWLDNFIFFICWAW